MKCYKYISNSKSPYMNLAMEDMLCDFVESQNEETAVVYFWVNVSCVVCGRNQNPFAECNMDYLMKNNIVLVRRKSGGGTVFQDAGNLNFTFIANEGYFDKQKSMMIVCNALNNLGIPAIISGRNDIIIKGKKISGSAFCRRDNACIHHGTLLIDTDLEKMLGALTPDDMKLKVKGIRSVRSRVMNLRSIYPDYTIPDYMREIKKVFLKIYDEQEFLVFEDELQETNRFREYLQSYSSDDWIYGYVPDAEVLRKRQFEWGNVTILETMDVSGKNQFWIYSDCLDTCTIELAKQILNGNNSLCDISVSDNLILHDIIGMIGDNNEKI